MAVTSTTAQNYEQVSYTAPGLSMHRAVARQVIGLTAARTLDIKESGSLVCFDAAAGFTVTLPAPVVGAYYDFVQTVTQTSGTQKVITNAATVFILGNANIVSNSAATAEAFAFDGSTHIAVTTNGTTTGGYVGSLYRLTAINSTQWVISGALVGSGTLATMASTT